MKQQKFFMGNRKVLSITMAGVALILFICACSTKGGLSVFLHILWVLCLAVGIYFLYTDYRQNQNRINFFLYDRRRKKKLKKEELTFEQLNDNLTYYLSHYVKRPVDLWQGIPKSLHIQTDAAEAFRPLFCYRMLYELSLLPDEEIKEQFLDADEKTVSYLCKYISAAGDEEMAQLILKMKRDFVREEKYVVPFFKRNKRVFEGRMLRFALRHIDEFVVEKNSISGGKR